MGNQDSTISAAAPEPIDNLQLTHLGPVTLMRSAQGFCLLKVFSFTDGFLMEERLRKFKARVCKIAENGHVLTMYSVSKMERKELCANNYQLHVFLEQPGTTLREVITQRLRDKQNFTQEELFSFLGRLVNSLLYIQDNGLKNIQLDSEAILFCGDHVKVLDCAIACSRTYYQLLERRQKGLGCDSSQIYLAPELLKELKEMNYDPYISPKADIFSIGMLLLEMVTLEPMLGYYDYSHAAIDYDSLIHRLSRISHSLPLKTLLAEMLEYDSEERIGLVSLKEKIHRLQHPQAEQTQIARSKSSKMLKEILSQSRKSGSLSRGEGSAPLSRLPSTDRKNTSRIELHCSGKKLEMKDSRELSKGEKGKKEEPSKKESSMGSGGMEQGIDQLQFKNLVKNRLIKDREKNKENAANAADFKLQTKPAESRKAAVVQTRMLLERNSNRQDTEVNRFQTLQNSKFQSGASSKILECSLGYNQASLVKLVEESGIKHLLKLEHLDESGLKRSQPDSMKNTSRFADPSDPKEKNHMAKPLPLRKISEIYIREEEEAQKAEPPIVTAREPVSQERQLQKVMTFNNKEFLISARSVERSVEEPSPPRQQQERLVFSPIATEPEPHESSSHSMEDSPSSNLIIKDIPVVISQEKVYEPAPPHNFGRLQRNLQLMECAQSIQQDTSNDGFSNSKVIESFKPQGEENYRSVGTGIANSKVEAYSHENSCFLKKNKTRRPELNIQLHDEDDYSANDKSFQQKSRTNQISETPYQKQPAGKAKLAKLDHLYRTSQSIQQFSNFTSISPPQDSKDSNSTFQLLFERRDYQNNTGSSLLNKATFSNGDSYQGELSPEGLPHGNGILDSHEGYQYSGSFIDGRFHGFGTLLNLRYRPAPVDYRCIDLSKGYWTRFEGEFENGTKTGFGTIFFEEGEKFSGCLKRDVIEGYGCFYKKTKELISGLWSQNKFKKI